MFDFNSAVTLTGFKPDDALRKMQSVLPASAYKKIDGVAMDLTDVDPAYLTEYANLVFGMVGMGWWYDFDEPNVSAEVRVNKSKQEYTIYTVTIKKFKLFYRLIDSQGNDRVSAPIFASGEAENQKQGWAIRGAITNAINAAFSKLEWQMPVYKNEVTHKNAAKMQDHSDDDVKVVKKPSAETKKPEMTVEQPGRDVVKFWLGDKYSKEYAPTDKVTDKMVAFFQNTFMKPQNGEKALFNTYRLNGNPGKTIGHLEKHYGVQGLANLNMDQFCALVGKAWHEKGDEHGFIDPREVDKPVEKPAEKRVEKETSRTDATVVMKRGESIGVEVNKLVEFLGKDTAIDLDNAQVERINLVLDAVEAGNIEPSDYEGMNEALMMS